MDFELLKGFIFSPKDLLDFVTDFLTRCLDDQNYEWFDKDSPQAPAIKGAAEKLLNQILLEGEVKVPSEDIQYALGGVWNDFVGLALVAALYC